MLQAGEGSLLSLDEKCEVVSAEVELAEAVISQVRDAVFIPLHSETCLAAHGFSVLKPSRDRQSHAQFLTAQAHALHLFLFFLWLI